MSLNGIFSGALLTITLALFAACGREPLLMEPAGGESTASGGVVDASTGGTGGKATGGVAGTAAGGSGGHGSGGVSGGAMGGAGGVTPTGGVAGGASAGAVGGTRPSGGTGGAVMGGAVGGTRPSGGTGGGAMGGAVGGTRPSGGTGGTMMGGAVGGMPASGGASGSGGSGGAVSCTGVVCAPIPSSCKKLVQDPNACCPTCADTGCRPCAPLTCPVGFHQETVAGDCCPSCIANPPDPCIQGQKDYATMRQQMLDKYSSSGCKNSSDCALVVESNACTFACNVPLPKVMASSFAPNLQQSANSFCRTCPAPTKTTCDPMVPACVNGKCVAASAR